MKFRGKITWMYNPGHLYVQLEDNGEFSRLMEDMQAEFRSGTGIHRIKL